MFMTNTKYKQINKKPIFNPTYQTIIIVNLRIATGNFAFIIS